MDQTNRKASRSIMVDDPNDLALELRTIYLAVMDLDRSMDGCKLFQSHIEKRQDRALFWPAALSWGPPVAMSTICPLNAFPIYQQH